MILVTKFPGENFTPFRTVASKPPSLIDQIKRTSVYLRVQRIGQGTSSLFGTSLPSKVHRSLATPESAGRPGSGSATAFLKLSSKQRASSSAHASDGETSVCASS